MFCPTVADGRSALKTDDPLRIIQANAGGPYGSAALRGVQAMLVASIGLVSFS